MLSQCRPRRIAGGFRAYTTGRLGKKQRIVVVGSGWAGFSFLKGIDANLFDITVISPRSYFVFTPLLAGTAVGTLEFRCALESVRDTQKCTFHEALVKNIDFKLKRLSCTSALHSRKLHNDGSFDIDYDMLILTPGSLVVHELRYRC